jgi:replicative DNA helicase
LRSRRGKQVEVAELSRGLKALIRDLETPVIALSQLAVPSSTGPTNGRCWPTCVSQGRSNKDSDVVCFIYRDDQYDPVSPDRGLAEIIVAKNRNAPPARPSWRSSTTWPNSSTSPPAKLQLAERRP